MRAGKFQTRQGRKEAFESAMKFVNEKFEQGYAPHLEVDFYNHVRCQPTWCHRVEIWVRKDGKWRWLTEEDKNFDYTGNPPTLISQLEVLQARFYTLVRAIRERTHTDELSDMVKDVTLPEHKRRNHAP